MGIVYALKPAGVYAVCFGCFFFSNMRRDTEAKPRIFAWDLEPLVGA